MTTYSERIKASLCKFKICCDDGLINQSELVNILVALVQIRPSVHDEMLSVDTIQQAVCTGIGVRQDGFVNCNEFIDWVFSGDADAKTDLETQEIMADGHDMSTSTSCGLNVTEEAVVENTQTRESRLRRLHSSDGGVTALDLFYEEMTIATRNSMQGNMELFMDALMGSPEILECTEAFTALMQDLQNRLSETLTERQRGNLEQIWEEYTEDGNDTMSLKEMEILMNDVILLWQKNIEYTFKVEAQAFTEQRLGVAKVAIKVKLLEAVKQAHPGLNAEAANTIVEGLMPADSVLDDKMTVFFTNMQPVMVECREKVFSMLIDDKASVSKTMIDEMAENKGAGLMREEFVTRFVRVLNQLFAEKIHEENTREEQRHERCPLGHILASVKVDSQYCCALCGSHVLVGAIAQVCKPCCFALCEGCRPAFTLQLQLSEVNSEELVIIPYTLSGEELTHIRVVPTISVTILQQEIAKLVDIPKYVGMRLILPNGVILLDQTDSLLELFRLESGTECHELFPE